MQGGHGSVRLRFVHKTVPAVPVSGSDGSSGEKVSHYFRRVLTERHGSGSGFGFQKTVPAVPVRLSVPGKTVPTVPVSGSSSVPGPSCKCVRQNEVTLRQPSALLFPWKKGPPRSGFFWICSLYLPRQSDSWA